MSFCSVSAKNENTYVVLFERMAGFSGDASRLDGDAVPAVIARKTLCNGQGSKLFKGGATKRLSSFFRLGECCWRSATWGGISSFAIPTCGRTICSRGTVWEERRAIEFSCSCFLREVCRVIQNGVLIQGWRNATTTMDRTRHGLEIHEQKSIAGVGVWTGGGREACYDKDVDKFAKLYVFGRAA